jgi:hypothetical protein
VAGDGAVRDLSRAIGDHHHVGDLAVAVVLCALRRRAANAPARAKVIAELALERPARLDEQRDIDRLVRDPHR